MEPLPSLLIAIGRMPEAMAAPEPALDRPAVRSVSTDSCWRQDPVEAGAGVTEFRNIGLADDHRAGRLEALDHDIVFRGHEIL